MTSARRMGIEPDAAAGRLFRCAAAQLSATTPDSEEQHEAASAAGAALIGLALAEAEGELRVLLTPDPSDFECVWTVACYQIGDLTPSALRDFPDPVEAVATVAGCPDDSHVAAELIASTAGGLHWTAVTRTNNTVLLQLPSADTTSDGSRERAGELANALGGWRDRLHEWAALDGAATGDELAALGGSRGAEPDAFDPLPVQKAEPSGRSPALIAAEGRAAAVDVRLEAVNARLAAIEGRFANLEFALMSIWTTIQAVADGVARSTASQPTTPPIAAAIDELRAAIARGEASQRDLHNALFGTAPEL